MHSYDIFVDGSCLDNGQPTARGGWAIVVTKHGSSDILFEDYGKIRTTAKQTNNRAELEAMLQGLIYLDDNSEHTYYLYSDSEVVVNGILGTSARNANRDIWAPVEKLCAKHMDHIKDVIWIEGHKDDADATRLHELHNYCDVLAKKGANSLLKKPLDPNKDERML